SATCARRSLLRLVCKTYHLVFIAPPDDAGTRLGLRLSRSPWSCAAYSRSHPHFLAWPRIGASSPHRIPLPSNGWLSQRVQSPSGFGAQGAPLFALLSELRPARARGPTPLARCGEIARQRRSERAGQHAIAAAFAAHDAVDLEILQVLAHHRPRRTH